MIPRSHHKNMMFAMVPSVITSSFATLMILVSMLIVPVIASGVLYASSPVQDQDVIMQRAYAASGASDLNGSSDESQSDEPQNYMGFNVDKIFDPASGTGSGLLDGGTNVLEIVVDRVLLPVALLLASWRTLYIAIFCIMADSDPIDMMNSDAGKKMSTDIQNYGVGTKKSKREWGEAVIKEQLKGMFFGVLAVLVVWSIIKAGIWVATVLLGLF